MSVLTQADAMSVLDPIFDDLDAVCRLAHAKYRGYPGDVLIEHDQRAEACCIYAHMLAEAERRLTERSEVVALNIKGLFLWVVSDAVTIRFKKMDEDGRSRSYPTKQAKAYDQQSQLPGLPAPPVNLVVGYLPDATSSEIVRIQVARPRDRKSMEWCAALIPTPEQVVGRPRWIDVTRQASAF